MRIRIGMLLFVFFGLAVALHADEEHSQLTARRFDYWRCLANEIVEAAHKKISPQVFAVYIRGKCTTELQNFRLALTQYFAETRPSMPTSDHMASADLAISEIQDDAFNVYEDRTGQCVE